MPVLVVGSSAGGIAALMHTDYFAEQWPLSVVKGAPECGFFYPGVTASNDVTAGVPTPASHLGFIEGWKPYLPSACADATNNNVSLCTDAHYLYPYLRAPLFIRENQVYRNYYRLTAEFLCAAVRYGQASELWMGRQG